MTAPDLSLRPAVPHLWQLRAMVALAGFAWGMTGPLTKLAISTGHNAIGISFWSTLFAAGILSGVLLLRGQRLPLGGRHIRLYLSAGLLGTALPNALSFTAYGHLPIGIMVMLLSLLPMVTLLMAWPLGLERPTPRRLAGIVLGMLGVALIVLPGTSLPDPAQAIWILAPLIVAISYSGESIVIAWADIRDMGPTATLCGMSWGALSLITPVMLITGTGFDITAFGAPELAVMGLALLNLVAYAGYIWLIGHAGPVFASQTGYVVTGTGVLLGMIFFGERHSIWVWGALCLIVVGVTMVQPKQDDP